MRQFCLVHCRDDEGEKMEILQKCFLLAFFASLVIAEKYYAKRKEDPEVVKRSYVANLWTGLFNDTILSILSVSSLVVIAGEYSGFGFLNFMPLGVGMKVFASFILYDLTLYLWHKERHYRPSLWKFHRVHHSDVVMNATTTFRLHIVEVFLTTIVKSIFVIITGSGPFLLLMNEVIITAIVMLSHTNITFRHEKLLSYVFIVPKKHAIHHGSSWREHGSNFGFALSIWDRIFGTCRVSGPQDIGLYGIEEQGFLSMLLLRFRRKTNQ